MLGLALAGFSSADGGDRPRALPLKLRSQPSSAAVAAFAGGGARHVSYELFLDSFDKAEIHIRALRVRGTLEGREVCARRFEGDALSKIYSGNSAADYGAPQSPVLAPGNGAILFLFLDFPRGDRVPDKLTHTIEADAPSDDAPLQSIPGGTLTVRRTGAAVIGSPLAGEGWWTPNGPSNFSIHRRTVLVVGGRAGLSEQFAVDWVRIGESGAMFEADSAKNANHYAYGAEILAVGDGRVAGVLDGVPENIPDQPPAVPITLENVAGNHVVQELGAGRYALYAHMIPGSLRVQTGDRVRRGQLLGRLGNSGNSSAPHLHFQLMAGPEPLGPSGIPFLIDRWTRRDHAFTCDPPRPECDPSGPTTINWGRSHRVRDETFMNDDVGDFAPARR